MSMQRVGVRAVVDGVNDYLRDFSRMDQAVDQHARKTQTATASITKNYAAFTVGVTAATAALAALGAGAAAAISVTAAFSQQLANIKAVSGASAEDLAQLATLARTVGVEFGFGATESAKGITELVKAGVSLSDILGGALKSSLTLAAAGEIEVADAAEIAANAMAQFGLKGEDVAKVADQVAGAANASSISVRDFQLSLGQIGAVASLTGQTFESTAQAIAVLGTQGLKSSDAGTSLKQVLLNLQPSAKRAADEMRALGLITADGANAFFDASGKAKSMKDIAGVLATALDGLSEKQKLASLEIIFGGDAIRAAGILAKVGSDGFDEMAASMGKVSAETVALGLLDTVNGDIKKMNARLEELGIRAGSEAEPALRNLLSALSHLLDIANPVADAVGEGMSRAFTGLAASIGIAEVAVRNLLRVMEELPGVQNLLADVIGAVVPGLNILRAAGGAARDLGISFGIPTDPGDVGRRGVVPATRNGAAIAAAEAAAAAGAAATRGGRTQAEIDAVNKKLAELAEKALGAGAAAKEAKTGFDEFGISLDNVRKVAEIMSLSGAETDSIILALGGTALDTGEILDGLGITAIRLASAFDSIGLDGAAAVEAVQSFNAAQKAKAEAEKAAQEQDRLNAESAGVLTQALEAANFSLEEQRSILGALGVAATDIGPKIEGVGVTAERLALHFERAGLSADAAAEAVQRVVAAIDAVKLREQALNAITGIGARDVLGSIRSRTPASAEQAVADAQRAAGALEQLTKAGLSTDVAINILETRVGNLGALLSDLGGDEGSAAGAALDGINKLIVAFHAGTIGVAELSAGVAFFASDLSAAAAKADEARRKIEQRFTDFLAREQAIRRQEEIDASKESITIWRDKLDNEVAASQIAAQKQIALIKKISDAEVDAANRQIAAANSIAEANDQRRIVEARSKALEALEASQAGDAIGASNALGHVVQLIGGLSKNPGLTLLNLLQEAVNDQKQQREFLASIPTILSNLVGSNLASLSPELAALPLGAGGPGSAAAGQNITYNVTANYSTPEEPQSLMLDLQSIAMLSRR